MDSSIDRQWLELKFSSLESRIEAIRVTFADHEQRLRTLENVADLSAMYRDHETRLRALEKQKPWQWIVQAAAAIAAAIGIRTGL
jgi:hypothetical protein